MADTHNKDFIGTKILCVIYLSVNTTYMLVQLHTNVYVQGYIFNCNKFLSSTNILFDIDVAAPSNSYINTNVFNHLVYIQNIYTIY